FLDLNSSSHMNNLLPHLQDPAPPLESSLRRRLRPSNNSRTMNNVSLLVLLIIFAGLVVVVSKPTKEVYDPTKMAMDTAFNEVEAAHLGVSKKAGRLPEEVTQKLAESDEGKSVKKELHEHEEPHPADCNSYLCST
ncbi:hypothetical protein PMAYCL1PPCAC_04631, partial [Pristionchus mayeri]